ncbi:MAG: hypothetical protein H0W02_14255 [Ktedonobacteraceae bacterium]|nr:hypothetical protein [Ktedonobacteraceae bacterium]
MFCIIIVHQESSPHLHGLIQQIKAAGKMAGVALNPATPALLLEDVLPLLDMVLVMTINPGFEKQEFLPETLPKIARLRQVINERALACDIEVDGRIQENTARQVARTKSVARRQRGSGTSHRLLRYFRGPPGRWLTGARVLCSPQANTAHPGHGL